MRPNRGGKLLHQPTPPDDVIRQAQRMPPNTAHAAVVRDGNRQHNQTVIPLVITSMLLLRYTWPVV